MTMPPDRENGPGGRHSHQPVPESRFTATDTPVSVWDDPDIERSRRVVDGLRYHRCGVIQLGCPAGCDSFHECGADAAIRAVADYECGSQFLGSGQFGCAFGCTVICRRTAVAA